MANSIDLARRYQVPGPRPTPRRLGDFTLAASGQLARVNAEHGRVSVGLGDIHLRAKYHVFDWEGLQGALGLANWSPILAFEGTF